MKIPSEYSKCVTVESRDVIPRYEILCAEAQDLECPKGDLLLRRAVPWTE
ncbi:MAG: hypothetical protein JWN14_2845 [Chthonomonadales bacterium]|nr:hypothetical protein [Chthonomonadales bacterium]